MAFPQKIKEQILVDSARHCCVCHKSAGLKIEVHHIIPQEKGGEDIYDNAIALCFDCHADAGHYYAKHPKGMKLSPTELKLHKEKWLEIVRKNNIEMSSEIQVELVVNGEKKFYPEFIEERTKYLDKGEFKSMLELLKIDYKNNLKELKTGHKFYDFQIDKVKSFDDYVDFLNGEFFTKKEDSNSTNELNIQPNIYSLGIHSSSFGFTKDKTKNLSICTLRLRLINNGPDVLEDFKIYLDFKNVKKADTIDKSKEYLDFTKYEYNVIFSGKDKAEFIPNQTILVQNDFIYLDPICFLTDHNESIITLDWKLVARGFNKSDKIQLTIKPRIEIREYEKYVDNPASFEPKTKIRLKYK